MKLIEKLILETASEEDLNLDQFITEVRKDPDDWYAFRRHELVKFVNAILEEVATLTDSSEVAVTGPSLEDIRAHFGLTEQPTEDEQPIDWHGFNS